MYHQQASHLPYPPAPAHHTAPYSTSVPMSMQQTWGQGGKGKGCGKGKGAGGYIRQQKDTIAVCMPPLLAPGKNRQFAAKDLQLGPGIEKTFAINEGNSPTFGFWESKLQLLSTAAKNFIGSKPPGDKIFNDSVHMINGHNENKKEPEPSPTLPKKPDKGRVIMVAKVESQANWPITKMKIKC